MDKMNNEDKSTRQTIINRTIQECIEIEQPNNTSQKNNSNKTNGNSNNKDSSGKNEK